MKQAPIQNFSALQKRLKQNKKLSNYNYRGERTFVVVSGLNSDLFNLSQVKGLNFYEERMLFFLFLLKYNRTKIIYVTSKGFNIKLFDYYLDLIAENPKDFKSMQKRLTHLEIDDSRVTSMTQKLLDNREIIEKIKGSISNFKTAVLRCYYPTMLERKLALEIGIPLFGSNEKFDYIGTKSGSRRVFKLSGLNLIPGYGKLENTDALYLALAKLMKNYPSYKQYVVKLDICASGRGNAVFNAEKLIKDHDLEISIKTDVVKLAKIIRKVLKNYLTFQSGEQSFDAYMKEYNKVGGIAEALISAKFTYSPSVQISISAEGKPYIISSHEQILGGPNKQNFLGCAFPSRDLHRQLIAKEAKKVAIWMAKKGMIGHFGIDFVTIQKTPDHTPRVYPIEINLRKGGTTHPYRLAYFLTSAHYDSKKGILHSGKIPVCYEARDIIESEKYKALTPGKLIEIIESSKIGFNKNTKKGVLVYMPGMISEYGKFGAIAIGHSHQEASAYYKKMIKLIAEYLEKN